MILRELPPAAGLPLCVDDFLKKGRHPLEVMLANFLKVPYVQIASSAPACLVIALSTLKKFSPRKEVIVPALCSPKVIHAINQAGLKVRVCETQAEHFDYDYEQLALLAGEQTLCIVLTHLAGIPADLIQASRIAKQSGAFLLEDATQALGAKHMSQRVGTMGDIGIFSLNSAKGVDIVEIGALVSHNGQLQSALAETGRRLLKQRPKLELTRILESVASCVLYNPLALSFTYGSELRQWLSTGDPQRAIGEVFTPPIKMHKVSDYRKRIAANALYRMPHFQNRCRSSALHRIKRFSTISGITALTEGYGCEGTYPYLTLIFDRQEDCETVLNEIWAQGLGISKLFHKCVSENEHLVNFVPSTKTPAASSFARRTLTISNSPMMNNQDFQNVFDTVLSVLQELEEFSSEFEEEPASETLEAVEQ